LRWLLIAISRIAPIDICPEKTVRILHLHPPKINEKPVPELPPQSGSLRWKTNIVQLADYKRLIRLTECILRPKWVIPLLAVACQQEGLRKGSLSFQAVEGEWAPFGVSASTGLQGKN